ncbi:MAG: ApbE family protein [Microgenomates bacterium OLB22]|nr:MAG: ApbE family protein [Microgenomates bacterium OLB22]
MRREPLIHQFYGMACTWEIRIWDELSPNRTSTLILQIEKDAAEFESFYSRFKEDSLLKRVEKEVGRHEVPADFIAMLRIYEGFYTASAGAFSPLVGGLLSDIGYDRDYRLTPLDQIQDVPSLGDSISIVNENTLEIHKPISLDLGGIGKGYFC